MRKTDIAFKNLLVGKTGFNPDHILGVAKRASLEKPIFPIVVRSSAYFPQKFILLDDGISRVVYSMMNSVYSVPAFVADSPDDRIQQSWFGPAFPYSVENANNAIKERWNECEDTAIQTFGLSYKKYFEQLTQRYPEFANICDFSQCRELMARYGLQTPDFVGTLDELNIPYIRDKELV